MGEYSHILEQQGKTTSEKLAEFTAAIGWRDELGTYQMEMENYEMQVAQQQAEIQQAQELQEAAAALGLDISSTVESALESIATTAPPYTAEELAALDAESAAYYDAFSANYVATAAFTGSGSGTQSDPYIITNRVQLEAMADDLTAYYQLGNNIDLGGSSSPWTPIGSISAPFSGTLDGQGYGISNMYLDITDRYFGLFSAIAGSTVSHVLISATATNEGVNFGDFGAIAGCVVYTNAPTSFVQCTISIDFSGTPVQNCFVGGIHGSLGSSNPSASQVQISDCVVDIQISVDTTSAQPSISAFGPVGTIYRSYATGSIQYLLDTGLGYPRGIGGISSGSRAEWVSVDSVVSLLTDIDAGVANAYRIVPVGSIVDAYANAAMTVNGNTVSGGTTTNANGADVSASTYNTQAFWQNTLGWDFDTVWYWDDTANLPKLRVFLHGPTISSVSATPTTGGTTTQITLSATVQDATSYQWQYRSGTSGSWQNIPGATSATATWTPGAVGTYQVQLLATNSDGTTTSDPVTVTIYPDPTISDVSIYPNPSEESATFLISAVVNES